LKRKRLLVLLALLALLALPPSLVLLVPEWRERAHDRWLIHKLRSDDRERRKLVIAALLARPRADISDEVFPELVAAAVAEVESRSVFVGRVRTGKPSSKSITLTRMPPFAPEPPESVVDIERALTPMPEEAWIFDDQVALQSPVFRLSNARSLFVMKGFPLELVVPLEGELGDAVLAAVEERLRRER